MPAFKFKLEKVLDYKKAREEERKRELAYLRGIYKKEEEVLKSFEEEQGRYQSELREKEIEFLDLFEILAYYRYLARLSQGISKQKLLLEELKGKIEKKLEEVIAASKERKVLEKLRERRFGEFQKYLSGLEVKFLDEIATSAYVRQRSASSEVGSGKKSP